MKYTLFNIIKGGTIYALGDMTASLILNEFMWTRFLGIMFVGMSFYAFEIPNYFSWIERKTAKLRGLRLSMAKTGLAMLYFNPLWIARHLLFIKLVSLQFNFIGWNLLYVATISFLINIPISAIANYIIQNMFAFKWRFVASAIFSGMMAVYYAMSETWFN